LFSALVENPHRFARRSQVYKFCQLGVTSHSSAGQPARKRLDKRGYGELKAISYRAWLCAANVTDDNEVKQLWKASCRLEGQLPPGNQPA